MLEKCLTVKFAELSDRGLTFISYFAKSVVPKVIHTIVWQQSYYLDLIKDMLALSKIMVLSKKNKSILDPAIYYKDPDPHRL